MNYRQSLSVAPSHPCLAGHFPGNPLVPGVVILDQVIAAVQSHLAEMQVCAVPRVKFLRPLRPGEPYTLQFALTAPGLVNFDCVAGETTIVRGTLALARMSWRSPTAGDGLCATHLDTQAMPGGEKDGLAPAAPVSVTHGP